MIALSDIKTHIAGHGIWKVRLREALSDGGESLDASAIRPDDRCALGIWLRDADPRVRASRHWHDVADHHRAFHEAAADVVVQIQGGDVAAAERSIHLRGDLSRKTSRLTLAMVAWMDDLD